MKDFLKWVVYGGIFIIPFIVLYVANGMFFPFITGKNFAFRIIVEIIFAAWVLLALYEPKYRPKFSWITAAFAGLVVVMFFADLFGQYPLKSFWSNFERMDGFVTLIHVFLYVVVVGSVMHTKELWNRLFNTTLVAAVLLAFYAFAQLSGQIQINQSSWRLDGTLGNAAYMAVYMLFHVFIALVMFVRTSSKPLKTLYAFLAAVFVLLLIQTATRGTILGLTGGLLLTTLYIALFATQMPRVRKVAAGSLLILVVLVGLFITFKDSSVIQNDARLSRVANITLSEASVRFTIWSMAFEGVKERPVLGWGHENFNYVFNKYYDPSLYAQEPWFDRVHNIVLDWLIVGGFVGAFFYFSILGATLFYIVVRPLMKKDQTFSVAEQGLLLGLLAGYVFHNMFVFDNIVSYMFFGMILAFVHSQVSRETKAVTAFKVSENTVTHIVAPFVVVILLGVVWLVNVPGIQAAGDVIDGFNARTPEAYVTAFERALSRDSFGNQEIREQMSMRGLAFLQAEGIPPETQQIIFKKVEQVLLDGIEAKPGDARLHVFMASFYRSTGNSDAALEQTMSARQLSPQKQQIIFEEGAVYLTQKDYQKAKETFKQAYDLAPASVQARVFYATAALYTNDVALFNQLISTPEELQTFARNTSAVQAAYESGNFDLLMRIFKEQIEIEPDNAQVRINLSLTYYRLGMTAEAIATLEELVLQDPSYKQQVDAVITDIRAGTLQI